MGFTPSAYSQAPRTSVSGTKAAKCPRNSFIITKGYPRGFHFSPSLMWFWGMLGSGKQFELESAKISVSKICSNGYVVSKCDRWRVVSQTWSWKFTVFACPVTSSDFSSDFVPSMSPQTLTRHGSPPPPDVEVPDVAWQWPLPNPGPSPWTVEGWQNDGVFPVFVVFFVFPW